MNSPSRSLKNTFVSSIMKMALFSLIYRSTVSLSLSVSEIIFAISLKILAGIIIFSFLLLLISCLDTAILNPSRAIIFKEFSLISTRMPVITPLDSSILAAKEVFLIISFSISLSKTILLFSSSSRLSFGNSLAMRMASK